MVNSLQRAADIDRVRRDVAAEGFDPADYNISAIARDMRTLAGERHLDAVSDDAWGESLIRHRRPDGGTQ